MDVQQSAFVTTGTGGGSVPSARPITPAPVIRAPDANAPLPGGSLPTTAAGLLWPAVAAGAVLSARSAAARRSRRRPRGSTACAAAGEPSVATSTLPPQEDDADDDEEEESIAEFMARYKQKPAAATSSAAALVEGPLAVPFMGPPRYRKFLGEVAGDSGFDPLNICGDVNTFTFLREAELKHCRLAMLAAAGWPMSELFQPALAEQFLRSNDLASNGRAPSVLNGGLEKDVLPEFMAVALITAMIVDLSKQMRPGGVGSYGFDPLSLSDVRPPVVGDWLPSGRNWMAEAELKNGRIAMLAITAFAMQEFVTKVPVVQQTPFFFGRF